MVRAAARLTLLAGLVALLPGLDLDLRPAATVAASVVRLGDVAPAVAADLAAIPLLSTAGIGRWTVDARVVRSADPRLAGATVRGVCSVERGADEITAAALATAALARITADAGADRIETTLLGLPPAARVPAGASAALVAEPLGPAAGRTALRVRILADGIEVDRRLVQVEIRRTREVLVAERPLAREAVIQPGDLRRAWLPVVPGRDDTLADPALATGRLLTTALAPGAPVLARHLRTAPLVRTGQSVRLVVRIGGAEAVGTATALGDGAPGERITVRRAADATTLLATVTGPGEVSVAR